MKKYISTLCIIILCSLFAGCEWLAEPVYSEAESDVSNHSEVSSESSESESESSVAIEEIFEFLTSHYTLTSTRESFGTVYVCDYYFVDGYVAGARVNTTLPNEETATEYYEMLVQDSPYAELNVLTVTDYITDEELNYYGYDLEKLKFMLDKSGYTYVINFNESEFLDDFYTSKTE